MKSSKHKDEDLQSKLDVFSTKEVSCVVHWVLSRLWEVHHPLSLQAPFGGAAEEVGSVFSVFCRKETIEEYVKKVKEEHNALQRSDRNSQEHRLMCSGFGHWIPKGQAAGDVAGASGDSWEGGVGGESRERGECEGGGGEDWGWFLYGRVAVILRVCFVLFSSCNLKELFEALSFCDDLRHLQMESNSLIFRRKVFQALS